MSDELVERITEAVSNIQVYDVTRPSGKVLTPLSSVIGKNAINNIAKAAIAAMEEHKKERPSEQAGTN